jgi:hypothetical protein
LLANLLDQLLKLGDVFAGPMQFLCADLVMRRVARVELGLVKQSQSRFG